MNKFTDRFHQRIEPHDYVIYMDRSYHEGKLESADIDFGRVIKYLPKGGVTIERFDGSHRRLLRLDKGSLVKVDEKFMGRIAMEKLATAKTG